MRCALSGVLGEEFASAIGSMGKACMSFGQVLNQEGMRISNSKRRSTFLNLALIWTKLNAQRKHQVPPTSDKEYGCKDVLIKAARYAQFAKAAYAKREVNIAGSIFGLEAKDVLYFHKSDGVSCPNFFIADDQETDAIVLSIRGTEMTSIADLMTNLVCAADDFLGGKAHKGMLASSENLMDKAAPILRDLIVKHPTRKLVVVGHSLGAGVAVLATLRLCSEQPGIIEGSPEVQCFAFAPPPVFGPPDKLPPKASSCIYSFVDHVDAIPRASVFAIARFLQAVTHVDSLPLSDEDTGTATECLAFLRDKASSSGSIEIPDEMPLETSTEDHLVRSFGNLSVVGKTLLLYEDEEGQRRCDEVGDEASPDVLKKFLLHPGMINAHKMDNYQNIVTNVGLPHPGYGPQGWDEVEDLASGRPYFCNRSTGETSWAPPPPKAFGGSPPLPQGWEQAIDPASGKPYFFSRATGETRSPTRYSAKLRSR